MKSFRNILALGALALVGIGNSAFAEDTTSRVVIPHALRCVVCGAPMDAVITNGKGNVLKIEVMRSTTTGNPRGN